MAAAGITLYTVGTVKHLPGIRTYVSVDGGMSDNPLPGPLRQRLRGLPARVPPPRRARGRSVSSGKHCESGDLVVPDAFVPDDLEVGDVLATPVTGAYGYAMASNYNKVPRPAVVFVSGGTARSSSVGRPSRTSRASTPEPAESSRLSLHSEQATPAAGAGRVRRAGHDRQHVRDHQRAQGDGRDDPCRDDGVGDHPEVRTRRRSRPAGRPRRPAGTPRTIPMAATVVVCHETDSAIWRRTKPSDFNSPISRRRRFRLESSRWSSVATPKSTTISPKISGKLTASPKLTRSVGGRGKFTWDE